MTPAASADKPLCRSPLTACAGSDVETEVQDVAFLHPVLLAFKAQAPGLDRLRGKGIPLACVTNKSARYTLPLLDMLGLARYFEQVVAGDTLARKKPHPDQLLHAAGKVGIAPGDMLMIGDSLNDAQAARAAWDEQQRYLRQVAQGLQAAGWPAA
mgnify:CR=1 FL=1